MFDFLKTDRRQQEPDVELGQAIGVERPFINGFPSTAELIARNPNHAFSMYRAFHRLTSRNLLQMEAELLELQKEQDDMDIVDFRGGPDSRQYFRSWKKLSMSQGARKIQRMELVEKIRKALKEYRNWKHTCICR